MRKLDIEVGSLFELKQGTRGRNSMANSALPDQIVESIAISNAKSIGEQPAILANLALANQVLNTSMQQQMMLSQQQAMNQITMATLAKCVSIITNGGQANLEESKEFAAAVDALNKVYDVAKKMVQDNPEPNGGADPGGTR
jgi:hypothetical protein